jgi:hypothetical protein
MNAALKLTCALALLSPLPAQEYNLYIWGSVVPVGWIDGRPAFATFYKGSEMFEFRNPAGTTHEVALYIHDFLAIDTRACAQGETARVWRDYYGPSFGTREAVVINGMAFTGFGHSNNHRMVWGDPMTHNSDWNEIGIFIGTWLSPTRDWPCRYGRPEGSITLFSLEIIR